MVPRKLVIDAPFGRAGVRLRMAMMDVPGSIQRPSVFIVVVGRRTLRDLAIK